MVRGSSKGWRKSPCCAGAWAASDSGRYVNPRAGRRAETPLSVLSSIQPYRCQNILIEGVTIVNSPMWEVHPVLRANVTVRNVSINGKRRTETISR